MPLSWNEIKGRATAFSKEWENEVSEDAEAKSFWDDFFNVFGIGRRRVATFEQQVKKIDQKTGFIDLLWKGVILVEHKSRGRDLDKAYQQAKDYFPGLKEKELPRYILVSDFERFRLYDLEQHQQHEFKLSELVNNVHLFGFIAGYEKRTYKEQDPVNIEAAELMGKLHDKLKAIGYDGHHLELYLVRLLFCLFADDTSIFEKGILSEYFELKTNEDGSDLAAHISQLFQVLNTHEDKRYKNLDEALAAFPYVNGKLFEEQLPMAHFDSEMRRILLDCCLLDWGKISPAIFGSLFQSVMDSTARRNLGAHYTSEKNILKLIKPLFLDELYEEFGKVKNDKNKLKKLHDKISKLRFLDPACGCGNFLIIAYRELRLLELEIVRALLKGQQITSVNDYFLVDVDRFYGIEYEEFPSQIAQVAMWLMDHQMNEQASLNFGEYYKRIPLKKSATIVRGNALRTDWQSLIDPMPWEKGEIKYDFILGNPPFIGAKWMSDEQRVDMNTIAGKLPSYGLLDYVTAWYVKSYNYLQEHKTCKVAFVSTNSITQGEQVSILWPNILKDSVSILFAYLSFIWTNEAKGNAKVHCVIIGLANNATNKKIYYTDSVGAIHSTAATNINPYLIDYPNVYIPNRNEPICAVPAITTGNKPIDNGYFIFDDAEKNEFVRKEPNAEKYFKKFIGALEFINGTFRWILDLRNCDPHDLRNMPEALERVKLVKEYRLHSDSLPTQKLALKPTRFHTEFIPESEFLILPEVSSERRLYIPIGYGDLTYVPSNKLRLIPNAGLYEFGILTSSMHNVWIKAVSGRMKSDISYSVKMTYNNFPWPENISAKQKATIEKLAQEVLHRRAEFTNSSLADLYDPNSMPPSLVKAHQNLDKAVELAYRSQPFQNDSKRVEFLFELYDKYTAGLFVREKNKTKRN